MSRLYKVLLLAAVGWSFLSVAIPEDQRPDALLLAALVAWTAAALVAAAWPARASTPTPPDNWFVRFGHLAWLPAVPLAVAVGLLLAPLHDLASGLGPGSLMGIVVHGTERAVATVAFFLVAASVVHGSMFLWSRRGRGEDGTPFPRHPASHRAVRAVRTAGIALLGLGLYVVLLGFLITLKDHTAADYWNTGAVAAPLLVLAGSGLWFLTAREGPPEAGTVAVDGA